MSMKKHKHFLYKVKQNTEKKNTKNTNKIFNRCDN